MYTGGSIDEDALQHYITRVPPTSESPRTDCVHFLLSYFFLFPFSFPLVLFTPVHFILEL